MIAVTSVCSGTTRYRRLSSMLSRVRADEQGGREVVDCARDARRHSRSDACACHQGWRRARDHRHDWCQVLIAAVRVVGSSIVLAALFTSEG